MKFNQVYNAILGPTNRSGIGNKAAAPTHSTGPAGSPARAPLSGQGGDARPPHARRAAPSWASPRPRANMSPQPAQLLPGLDLPPPSPPLVARQSRSSHRSHLIPPGAPTAQPPPQRRERSARAPPRPLPLRGRGRPSHATMGRAGAPRPGSSAVGASLGRARCCVWNPSFPRWPPGNPSPGEG